MGKDGLSIKLEGGARLDRVLSKMRQSVGTKIVNQSLTKGAAEVRKGVKNAAPKFNKDTTGFKTESRNIKKGQLRRSIKSGLRRKANTGRNVFLAGVWIQNAKGGAKDNADGWFAKQVIERHDANAFGYKGGNDFLSKGVKKSKNKFRSIVGDQLSTKIAAHQQKQINKI